MSVDRQTQNISHQSCCVSYMHYYVTNKNVYSYFSQQPTPLNCLAANSTPTSMSRRKPVSHMQLFQQKVHVQATRQEMRYPNVTSLYFVIPLVFNAPQQRGSPGIISVKFCTEVKGWLRYKMAKKYCRKFQPPEESARMLQTTDGFAIT